MSTSGSPNANGKLSQNETSIVNDTTLQADLTFLSSLLSKEGKDDNADVDVAALLRQLETADGVAQGVENRIDGILGVWTHCWTLYNLIARKVNRSLAMPSRMA